LNEYDIEEAFQEIEEELINSMIRNMKRHRVEEVKEGIEWEQWQVKQLQALERYKRENRKRFRSKFSNINSRIDEMILKSREMGNMEQEIEILKMMKKGLFNNHVPEVAETVAEFFRLNDRKLEALIKATRKNMVKAETAMLRMANDQYRKTIFNAQVYANTNAGTYEKAVDMATKDFLSSGINCIEYANGARVCIDQYAKMAIQTANKRAYLTGEGEKRKEWGISTVIMNKRGAACPKCAKFAGKILIDDVWSGGSAKDGRYPLMSAAIRAGLYHPNCKDKHTTYFEGISDKPKALSKSEIELNSNQYTIQQQQKYYERQVRKYKRLEEGSLDEENRKKYKDKRIEWVNKDKKWVNDHKAILRENKGSYKTRGVTFQRQIENEYPYINFDINHKATSEKELLFRYDQAIIPEEKLTAYALNKEHSKGKYKAIAFEKYLGYNLDNYQELMREINLGLTKYKSSQRAETKYGIPYEVPMVIKGANGKYARIKTGWIIDNNSTVPRLTSVYVDE
jgi:hypothetical protein